MPRWTYSALAKCRENHADQLYNDGKSLTDISKIIGVGEGTIVRYLNSCGVKRRSLSEALKMPGKTGKASLSNLPNNIRPEGSKRMNRSGYVLVKIGSRWIQEHRYVMEVALGRPLGKDEVIHHLDGNKTNNSLDNLKLMKNCEHTIFHSIGSKKSAETRRIISEKTKARLSDERNHPSYKHISPDDIITTYRELKNKTLTAKALGITKRTLYNKLEKLNIKLEV